MGKITLLILLVGVFALINPSMRERAMPYARPYLEKGLAPVYEYSVKTRTKDIARRLQEAAAAGEQMPTPAEFSNFLVRYYNGVDADLDPWGQPYYLRGSDMQYRAVSAGPDRAPDTGDDIYSPWIRRR